MTPAPLKRKPEPRSPNQLDPAELINGILTSCVHAARGIFFAAQAQRNFRIHLMAAVAVLGVGAWLRFTRVEMAILAVTCSVVIMGELLNTGLEYLLNLLEARDHPAVKAVKDVAAGAVLLAVAGSVLVGLLLFGPRLMLWVRCLVCGGKR